MTLKHQTANQICFVVNVKYAQILGKRFWENPKSFERYLPIS
ncbi:hypothetical protein LYNGBM3L_72810 [Moorena producens 3L]|uniref:Uncharacterized protein n=1 Tax=Moorena producens 3L TaxID=489825 RepID=F4Y3P1_9CYAN|nr:hypothetical protein LYNGBM3L_72810 [Moorena producens 3L]